MNKLLIVCGPTATGKTKVAVALAKKFNGELVSADSRQVYKGLDALTGKDRSKDIPIWLYDVIDVGQSFSVAQFTFLAHRAIDDIHKRKKIPIVVGGTGLYISSLISTINTLRIPPNVKLREKLSSLSLDILQNQLQQSDMYRWLRMNQSDQKNPRRLIRAIEIAKSEIITYQEEQRFDALCIGLTIPLFTLKERIFQRVKTRWDSALSEVRVNLPTQTGLLHILGIDPLLAFLRGEVSKEKALQQWATAEFQYAKRQMTWFKKQKNITWFDIPRDSVYTDIGRLVQIWYTKNNDIKD